MSTPASPGAPLCSVCGEQAAVNWVRRLVGDELASLVAHQEAARARLRATAPPDRPPMFGPLPTQADSTRLVHACATHAIRMDLAALVHQGECSAPNAAHLPGCDCTPEPPSPPSELEASDGPPLPDHWQT